MVRSTDKGLSRREFGLGLGAFGAGLTIAFRFAEAQTAPTGSPPSGPPVPPMIKANPQLDSWVRIAPDGSITVMTGRVEIGQGTLTAMRQIAAEELDVAPARITLISGDTARTPNEGITSGSLAIKLGGSALGLACADARATLVKVAADAWGMPADNLTVQDGVIGHSMARQMHFMTYAEAAAKINLARPVDITVKRKPPAQATVIGTSMPRTDIPAKVFGERVFIHDLRPDGMLFGAIARPPAYAARLTAVDLAPIKAMPGVVEVVRDGSFLGVIAKREEQARAAAAKLATTATWDRGPELFDGKSVFDYMLATPPETKVIHQASATTPAPAAHILKAEYRRDFQAHASIGASCALAQWEGDKLTAWSHTQGPFPLRDELAKAFKIKPDIVRVIHEQGAGCYGHNGADDVAFDAARLARAVPGRPVRVHWDHSEEMAWEPWSSAMMVRLDGSATADGTLVNWNHDVWSFPHSTRPGRGDGCNLRSAWYLAEPMLATKAVDAPLPNGASGRNAVPIYQFQRGTITTHFYPEMPIRTSALRTLGGFFNAVSAEMFIDELAAKAGIDPVTFRAKNVTDPRLTAVLTKAVAMSDWKPAVANTPPSLTGTLTGTGVGLSRYKNSDCYVCVVARVEVDTAKGAIRVLEMWSATDTGRIITPDGVTNQIEGGMIQATSWMLLEQGRWDKGLMTTTDYAAYPIIDFEHVPKITSVLIDKPELPSLGAGEGSQAPAGAAIANAVFAAIGRRVPSVPMLPERVMAILRA